MYQTYKLELRVLKAVRKIGGNHLSRNQKACIFKRARRMGQRVRREIFDRCVADIRKQAEPLPQEIKDEFEKWLELITYQTFVRMSRVGDPRILYAACNDAMGSAIKSYLSDSTSISDYLRRLEALVDAKPKKARL